MKISICLIIILGLSMAHASDSRGIVGISQAYLESKKSIKEAASTKSIERALRALGQADTSIRETRKQMRNHTALSGAEQRMMTRISVDLLDDEELLKDLKADMGLATSDSISSYITLRRSLLQDPEQKEYVIKMDLQILKSLERQSLTDS